MGETWDWKWEKVLDGSLFVLAMKSSYRSGFQREEKCKTKPEKNGQKSRKQNNNNNNNKNQKKNPK